MSFGCSKESSHRDGSFEYPQHMFWLRNKKIIFSYALLSGGHLNQNEYHLHKLVLLKCFPSLPLGKEDSVSLDASTH